MKKKYKVQSWGLTVLLTVISLIFLFPVYFLIVASLQPTQYMFSRGLSLVLGDTATLDNYITLFQYRNGMYIRWFINSIGITVVNTIGSVALSSIVGYALGMYRFKGRTYWPCFADQRGYLQDGSAVTGFRTVHSAYCDFVSV